MSDKNLTELEWKKFSKGRGLKDSAFIKALAALEIGKTPDAKLKALDDIGKEADALRKASKNDKEITDYLDDTDKAAVKERKLVEFAAKKEAAKKDSSGDDDEESPALLTSKMIPLLREVKKGDLVLQALIALAGKETVVLISRKAISPARGKLLKEQMTNPGGLKFIRGECLFEAGAVTFVVQAAAGGLAKRVKAALLAQTDLRMKVRVRGEDPNDIEDDGDAAEEEQAEKESGEGVQASTIPAAPPMPGPKEAPAAAPTVLSEEATAFNARLAELVPRVKEFVPTAPDPEDATTVRLKVSEAGVFARKKDYVQANALLDEAEAKMAQARIPKAPPMPGPKETPTAPPTVLSEEATAFNARLAALMPKVKEILTAGGPSAGDLKLKVSEAGVLARTKEFARANALLDEVQALLDSAVPAKPDPAQLKAEFEALHATLEPRVLEATGSAAPPALVDQVKAIGTAWTMAEEVAEAGNYERALLIMKRLAEGGALEKLLEARKAVATPGAPGAPGTGGKTGPSLVEQRKFMLDRWARIPAELNVELGSLVKILETQGGDSNPKELAAAIDTHLQDLLSDVKDQLDDAITAGDMGSIKGLRQRVEQDGVMAHLLKAPFMDGSKFKSAVLDAMDEIEAGLTA